MMGLGLVARDKARKKGKYAKQCHQTFRCIFETFGKGHISVQHLDGNAG